MREVGPLIISREILRQLSSTAALELKPEEETKLLDQLTGILEGLQVLEAVDGRDAPPMPPAPAAAVWRQGDQPVPSLEREQVLSQAPQERAGYFAVPTMVGEEDEG
ncbi:MAG: aspartyl/glutamyl-tRNA amidotransferase subunit C [Bacillota bacterium]|nr:aspartyl/glutamyl-tRNA amidotransferase subunit C [Bacillota bacterium]